MRMLCALPPEGNAETRWDRSANEGALNLGNDVPELYFASRPSFGTEIDDSG